MLLLRSLPLMGIGNPSIPLPPRQPADLITPHRDRKPSSHRRTASRVGIVSLPLMGIGNLLYLDIFGSLYETHYPSWGSETPAPPWTRRPRSPPSLPLMGIGNLAAACDWADDVCDLSLPLMGIGNARRRRRDEHLGALITPHGDRKLALPQPQIAAVHQLITPHGDRKPAHHPAPGRRGHGSLITPHGDRKLQRPPTARRNRLASLPLMGIGNRAPGPLQGAHRDLITPHGDRKPRPPVRRPPPAARPHYPSWGSETHHSIRVPRVASLSLPLMGIGNSSHPIRRSSFKPSTHYPSWGSETPPG